MDLNITSIGSDVIPIQPSDEVLLDIRSLVDLSRNKDYDYKPFIEFSNKLNELTHNFFDFNKNSFSEVQEVIDEKTLEKKLQIPVYLVLSFILYQLYDDSQTMDHEIDNLPEGELFKLLENRIGRIREIKDPVVLNKEFENFCSYWKAKYGYHIKAVDKIVKTSKKNPLKGNMAIKMLIKEEGANFLLTKEDIEEIKKGNVEDVYSKYINFGADQIQLLIDNMDKIEEELSSNDIKIVLNIDDDKKKDKVELYIAYKYMENACDSNDERDKQIYLYYLSNFFERYKNKISKLVAYDRHEDKILSLKELYEMYVSFLKDNPNLRIIDFKKEDFNDMNYDEIKEFMDEYLNDISANWIFLPSGNGQNKYISDEELEKIKEYIDSIKDPEKKRKALQDLDLFIKKKMFFDSSDPFYRVKGLNTFDGYFGYIYSNGMVILERFYENTDRGIIASNQAIYCMTIQDFYTLSKQSKSHIIANNLCKRFIHKGDWQQKVKDVISLKSQIVTAKELDKLVQQGSITI
ncbi:MAG: hypothetical protein IKF36_03135 [Bacilli bacterium]|nr:hypothetical protein [Bacilli bacterium]